MLFERVIFFQILALGFSGLGFLFTGAGFALMVSAGFSQPARQLAAHSAKLGQKSLTNDITSVVQSTVQLSETVQKMMQTNTGTGLLMVLVGGFFFLAAYGLVTL